MNLQPKYFDYAATTPLDPRVLEAMLPYLGGRFGNPSSVHGAGREARHAVESARETVASILGAEPAEILFTSGGTEADNAALRGVIAARRLPLLTGMGEHEAVLRTAEHLEKDGLDVVRLRPDTTGAVPADPVEQALGGRPALVSLMHTNNETGAVTDLRTISSLCRDCGAVLHTDAVQAVGMVRVDVNEPAVDLLSLSAHKFYGPKGVGALYVRSGTPFEPLLRGGSQERGRRGGTENVAGIVGLATALASAHAHLDERREHISALRNLLLARIEERLSGNYILNSPLRADSAAPHIVSLTFPPRDGRAVDGEMLLLNMDMEGVQVSAGSACTSGALEPSHVMLAIGHERAAAAATLRFSLGHETTTEDVDFAVDALVRVYERMMR